MEWRIFYEMTVYWQEPIRWSLHLPYKPLETTFARIFLFVDYRIPANSLSSPIKTKLLYNVTSSHAPVIAFVSQDLLSGRDPFNHNSNRSDREKRTTSKGGPVFSKLFRLDRTDPLSFGPKFPEILGGWIAPSK